ncbi:hypothetical protein NUW54_g9910 [Trametes sanguinea]|uniref:Uncharacterized protein n=1 Tax=Trametes sanguinea TaxID=158606 RepID=A0ACC1P2P9_9APHY|nr:hypothetical protein NUW54_g9910 [Trametes sanguinea]
MELRQAEVAETLQGNTHHARIRGPVRPAKELKLPILRKQAKKMAGREGGLSFDDSQPKKITHAMLDDDWLGSEHGSEFRSIHYVADWVAGETEVVDEGAGAGRADGEDEE